MTFLILFLIIAAFCLGLFIGYQVPHPMKLLPAPKKVEPSITPPLTSPIPESHLSEIARKLAEEK